MGPISEARARWLARHIFPHEPALRSWLRNKALTFDIDDIIQEAYTVLATKADIDGIHNPKAYLFQVAYSIILQELRRERVIPIATMPDVGVLEVLSDAPSPEDAVLARQELERVRQAVDSMPRQTRRAFTLRRIEGVSQAEIAKIMRLSVHTVEKHIARGIKILLATLADGGNTSQDASSQIKEPSTSDIREAKRRNYKP